jgi:hypothetical protein
VPPRLYGGAERIVSCLTEEPVRMGHEATWGDAMRDAPRNALERARQISRSGRAFVLALATVTTFGLSTAAFAQNPTASTPIAPTQERIQPAQSQTPGAHKMRTGHRTGGKEGRGRTPPHTASQDLACETLWL